MKFKRAVCALVCACVIASFLRIFANAEEDRARIYLESEIVSADTVKISVCIDKNTGFCGGFFALSYNENYLSYAFCVSGDIPKSMTLTPSLGDSGRVYILLDDTRNFSGDGALLYLYFRVRDEGADMLNLDIFGADTISLVRIDNGEILPLGCDFVGDRIILCRLPRVIGFQLGDENMRIVCAGNERYGILGIRVRAVYPEEHKIEEYIYYGYAYESLCGSEKLPVDYGAEYFFASKLKLDESTVCLFIAPFGYEGEKIIFGKEKILLFYKGEYI